jgi:hypothetical protein
VWSGGGGAYQKYITINLTTAQADTNYRVQVSQEVALSTGASVEPVPFWIQSKSTTQIVIGYNITDYVNPTIYSIDIFR